MERERSQIIYALVIRGQKVVLAEYTALAGNFQQATMQILQKLESSAEWKSYIYGEYAFHYIVDQTADLWFVESAIAYGMQSDFREELQFLLERYNSPDVDRVASMMAKVQHINDHLMESIDKILERQEKIELLVSRSQMKGRGHGAKLKESDPICWDLFQLLKAAASPGQLPRFVWNTMLKAYANAGDEAWQEWNQELYRRHLRPIDWDLFRRLLNPRKPCTGPLPSVDHSTSPRWAQLPSGTIGARDPPAALVVQFWPWPESESGRCEQQPEHFEDVEALWGYAKEKFVLRSSMAFNALRSFAPDQLKQRMGGSLRVAAMGGGPAAELFAAAVSRDLLGGRPGTLAVYEWVPTWNPIVQAVAQLLGEEISYHHCDVSKPLADDANEALREAAYDLSLGQSSGARLTKGQEVEDLLASGLQEVNARVFYKSMLSAQVVPNAKTYGKLMEAAAKRGETPTASLGPVDRARILHYSQLMASAAHAANLAEAEMLDEEVRSLGLVPTETYYNSLLNACAKAGDLASCRQLGANCDS
eukprot:g4555.t1